MLSVAIGVLIDWSSLDPMKALFWSAVINGIVAVPLMATMMLVASRQQVMGKFVARRWELRLGWLGTAIMAAAAVGLFVSFWG